MHDIFIEGGDMPWINRLKQFKQENGFLIVHEIYEHQCGWPTSFSLLIHL